MTAENAPREITLHHVGHPVIDELRIATDRGHDYTLWKRDGNETIAGINFQHGPVCEEGINGVTNESLLAIVADRLQRFQRGPMPCRENAIALTKIEEALHWLQTRTRRRLAAGVEGRGKP